MNLSFDNPREFEAFAATYMLGKLAELKQVTFEALLSAAAPATDRPRADEAFGQPNAPGKPVDGTDDGLTHEHIELPDAEPSDEAPVDPSAAEAPKRKRRTKAEIEAERLAAEAGKVDPGSQVQEPLTAAQTDAVQPDASERAFEDAYFASAEPVLGNHGEDLRLQEPITPTVPDATTPPLGASPEALAKVAEARAAYTPELIEELKAHADLFEPNRLEHMNEAREAISKKGFIPYNATMHGLGLASSIATYTDAEVKLHRAAIAHLLAS